MPRISSLYQRRFARFSRKKHWVAALKRKAVIAREKVALRRYWPRFEDREMRARRLYGIAPWWRRLY